MRKTVMKRAIHEEIYYGKQTGSARELLNIQMCGITYPDRTYEISRENSNVACLGFIEKGTGSVEVAA